MCLSTFSRRKYYSALYTFMCNTDLTVTTVIEWFPKTIPRSFRATNYLFSIVLVRRNTWGIRFSSENLIFEDRRHRWHSHGSIYWKFYLLELVRLINAHTGSMPFAKFSFALRPTLTKSVSGSYWKSFFWPVFNWLWCRLWLFGCVFCSLSRKSHHEEVTRYGFDLLTNNSVNTGLNFNLFSFYLASFFSGCFNWIDAEGKAASSYFCLQLW